MSCARNFTLLRKKDGSYLDRKEVFRSTLKKQDMFSTVIQPNHIQVRKKNEQVASVTSPEQFIPPWGGEKIFSQGWARRLLQEFSAMSSFIQG